VSEVRSSTKVTDEFFQTYCEKLTATYDLSDSRLQALTEALDTRPSKEGIGPDGKPFTRRVRTPIGTMQTLYVLFPELASRLFNELAAQGYEVPANLTWDQVQVFGIIFLSSGEDLDIETLKAFVEDEEVDEATLEGLKTWLRNIKESDVQPLFEPYIRKTDLAINVINSFKGKLEIYQMLLEQA